VVDDLLEAVVGHDREPVDGVDSDALAVGEAQAAPDRLLHERARVRGAQRDDRVEVGDVPALLEHVDVDHDLGLVLRILDRQQLLDDVVLLLGALLGVDRDDLPPVLAIEEGVALEQGLERAGVLRVLGDHEHEGLDPPLPLVAGVSLELDLGDLVDAHAVLELDALQAGLVVVLGVEILARGDGRLLDEAVGQGRGQWIAVDHVAEGLGLAPALDLRGRRELEAEHGPQLVDRAHAGRGAVAVRLVHQEHEVGELGQVLEVALPDVLGQALDARGAAAAHLGVDLGDVEDVDVDWAAAAGAHDVELAPGAADVADAAALLVVVARDEQGRLGGELRETGEHVLRRVGREVADELLVDREVRRQHEEVLDALGSVQPGDEGAHEAGLADAGREREAQRREVAVEALHLRELDLDGCQRGGEVGRLLEPQQLAHARQDRQGLALRRPQAQAVGDGLGVPHAAQGSSPGRASKSGVGCVAFVLPLLGAGTIGSGSCSGRLRIWRL